MLPVLAVPNLEPVNVQVLRLLIGCVVVIPPLPPLLLMLLHTLLYGKRDSLIHWSRATQLVTKFPTSYEPPRSQALAKWLYPEPHKSSPYTPYFFMIHFNIIFPPTSVSKSFRTCRLERELQMVQLSAARCSCIAILWLSIVSFDAITFMLLLECLFLFISLSTQSGNFWIHPRILGPPKWSLPFKVFSSVFRMKLLLCTRATPCRHFALRRVKPHEF
jgi:hypothetical protein